MEFTKLEMIVVAERWEAWAKSLLRTASCEEASEAQLTTQEAMAHFERAQEIRNAAASRG